MKRIVYILTLFFILLFQNVSLEAQQRFPKPEFENGHVQPETLRPSPRSEFLEYLDVFILFATLALVSWFVIKKRNRKGVFWISVFSLLYFGFIREGCVCSVGSIQNIALALFKPEYSIPITAILFFVLPILFTLLYGRTFCAGVCPLGAIQDLVALKPMKLKVWFQKLLGIIPFIYLGLSLIYAATGTDFIICRYDPFVGIFRLDGTFSMYLLGATFLIAGIFIARPYCRFFCPYGVILNLVSRVSKRHVTITPSKCIQCRLCEDSCPYGAIEIPTSDLKIKDKKHTIKRYIGFAFLLPLLILAGIWTGIKFHENLAIVNPKVQLAQELLNPTIQGEQESLEVEAFKSLGQTKEHLLNEAKEIINDFKTGAGILGGFIGLVFGMTLLSLTVFRYRTDYEPNKGHCLSCARCIDYCPVKAEEEE